jgi:hypothetical protein
VEVIGTFASTIFLSAAGSAPRSPMCGVCTSKAGLLSCIAARVSRMLTACVMVGRPRFRPSSTTNFCVAISGPPGVAFMMVLR